jgi:hypothetical protein
MNDVLEKNTVEDFKSSGMLCYFSWDIATDVL